MRHLTFVVALIATFAMAESVVRSYSVADVNGQPSSSTAGVISNSAGELQAITVSVTSADGGAAITPTTCIARAWLYQSKALLGDGGLGAWTRSPQLDVIMVNDGGAEVGVTAALPNGVQGVPPIAQRLYYATGGCGGNPHVVTIEARY